jgi:hypothetical protein
MTTQQPHYAPCGVDRCPNPHPAKPFVDRPLARRIAALHPVEEDRRPAWLRRGTAKDLTGSAA